MPADLTENALLQALEAVKDPDLGQSIVAMGMIKDVVIEKDGAKLAFTCELTTPACPYGEMLIGQAQKAVADFPNVNDAKIDLVWEPPWDPREMASDFAKDQLGIW